MLLGVMWAVCTPLSGQMTEEEKRRLFLQVREDIRPVPKASPSATPRPRPKPAATPKPTPRSTPKPRPTATPEPPEPEEPPTPRPTSTPKPAATPKGGDDFISIPDGPVTTEKRGEDETPERQNETPAPTSTPRPTPTPKPAKTSTKPVPEAPIVVEKSGKQEERGYEPPPKQAFGGLFKRWRYLTPGVRKAIDQARVKRGRWKYIIIHNSGTRQGNARVFDVYHRRVRKMQNGLAYHFVIGNGNSSGNGEIEIGSRWTRQINGGHVASDYLNDIAIGICLVGDLNRDKPTAAQLAALEELTTYLRSRVGRVQGKPAIVKGHKEINPRPTDCPGDRFPLSWLRQKFRS